MACAADSKDDAKGVVDDSAPPSDPTQIGKADDATSSHQVAVDVQSVHPYTNNLNKTYTVPFAGLPSCTQQVRVHFSSVQTEAGYDFVTVEPTGAAKQSFDGTLTDTWTEWFDKSGSSVKVRLKSDESVTRNGFSIDKVEWQGAPTSCPAISHLACGPEMADINPPTPVCGCPHSAVCVPATNISITHFTAQGFNRHSHQTTGTAASETHPGPADGPMTTQLGTVDAARVADIVNRAVDAGLASYTRTVPATQASDSLTITAGAYTVTFVAPEGTHDAAVQQLISDFEALFECDSDSGSLTCGSGMTCEEHACVEQATCICPAIEQPVCSTNGTTYSNSCKAGCANAEVAHNGACGVPGDPCGTIRGLTCRDDDKCRFGASQFTYPFPDAGGTCVAKNYCDAPADCNGQPHQAVPGGWACNANACAWTAGPQWQALASSTFESAHPYANSTSVWKQLDLPAGAQAIRFTSASFALEANYDFVEVWSWTSGAWKLQKRYTGATGPAATEEFAGQHFYLKFVSDSSVTKTGFKITVEYR
ncbi:MAG TPA: CUB domain-containing protein [Kofleriaceae bacterium]